MKCPNCGNEINKSDQFCGTCGFKIPDMQQHCPNCGADVNIDDNVCHQCGYVLPKLTESNYKRRYKATAFFLGVFLGGIGAHNFYLGNSSKGFFQAVLFFCGLFSIGFTTMIAIIWGLSEALMILAGLIQEDVDGHPLN